MLQKTLEQLKASIAKNEELLAEKPNGAKREFLESTLSAQREVLKELLTKLETIA